MKDKYVEILKNKSFWGSIACIFLMECLFGVVVKIRYGNLDAYIGLLLPMLAVAIVVFFYGTYKNTDKLFLVACVVLQIMGIMMQCIIQKSKASFALKEQILLIVALVGSIAFIILYNKVLTNLPDEFMLKLILAITVVTYVVLFAFGKATGGVSA